MIYKTNDYEKMFQYYQLPNKILIIKDCLGLQLKIQNMKN